MRESDILFNLASGRPLFEQEKLFRIITNNEIPPKPLEGILYEASAVKLWNDNQKYRVGGLNAEQIDQIESFSTQHGLFTGMVPQSNNRRYETQLGYVTPTFRTIGETDKQLLETVYTQVKPIIELEFPFAQVEMSADAVDIMAKGVSKDKPTLEYARVTGISLDHVAAIGDSGGDMGMLREVARVAGRVAYVGENETHIRELQSIALRFTDGRFIETKNKGPEGAVEFVRAILDHNKKYE